MIQYNKSYTLEKDKIRLIRILAITKHFINKKGLSEEYFQLLEDKKNKWRQKILNLNKNMEEL